MLSYICPRDQGLATTKMDGFDLTKICADCQNIIASISSSMACTSRDCDSKPFHGSQGYI